jgi:hypothetical protein
MGTVVRYHEEELAVPRSIDMALALLAGTF